MTQQPNVVFYREVSSEWYLVHNGRRFETVVYSESNCQLSSNFHFLPLLEVPWKQALGHANGSWYAS